MDIRKLGLGLGAFAAGAAAWVWGASRFGDRIGAALTPAPTPASPPPSPPASPPVGASATARTTPVRPAPDGVLDEAPLAAQRPVDADDIDAGVGAVPGDSTTSPIAPRPAGMAAAPVGMAETERHLPEQGGGDRDGHVPTDLLSDDPVRADTRAPDAFRPDPTAVPTAAEREALRPATGPAPTLVADRGSGFSEAAGAA